MSPPFTLLPPAARPTSPTFLAVVKSTELPQAKVPDPGPLAKNPNLSSNGTKRDRKAPPRLPAEIMGVILAHTGPTPGSTAWRADVEGPYHLSTTPKLLDGEGPRTRFNACHASSVVLRVEARRAFKRDVEGMNYSPEQAYKSSEDTIAGSYAHRGLIDLDAILDIHSHVSLDQKLMPEDAEGRPDIRLAVQMADGIVRRYEGDPAQRPQGLKHLRVRAQADEAPGVALRLHAEQERLDLELMWWPPSRPWPRPPSRLDDGMLGAMESLARLDAPDAVRVDLQIVQRGSGDAANLDVEQMTRLDRALVGFGARGGSITLENMGEFRGADDRHEYPLVTVCRDSGIEQLSLRNCELPNLVAAMAGTPLKQLSIGDSANDSTEWSFGTSTDPATRQVLCRMQSIEFTRHRDPYRNRFGNTEIRDQELLDELATTLASDAPPDWQALKLDNFRFNAAVRPHALFEALTRAAKPVQPAAPAKLTALHLSDCSFDASASSDVARLAQGSTLEKLDLTHSRGLRAIDLLGLLASKQPLDIDLRGATLDWPKYNVAGSAHKTMSSLRTSGAWTAADDLELVAVLAQAKDEFIAPWAARRPHQVFTVRDMDMEIGMYDVWAIRTQTRAQNTYVTDRLNAAIRQGLAHHQGRVDHDIGSLQAPA